MRAHRVLGFLLFGGSVWAQQYVISTIAGGVAPPTPTVAAKASVGDPTRVAADSAGDVYFSSLHSVFKVDPSGTLTRFAGSGRPGNSGDGGQATNAQLLFPMGIAIDSTGNVFVADRDANVVRRISPNGVIQTVAGNGTPGYQGDGGPATAAQLNSPFGVAVDSSGNLYIADFKNQAVRKVTTDGVIKTYAGNGSEGFSGDGAAARDAVLNGPEGVAVDGSGNLYIADTFNGRIRRVDPGGIITTAAGIGTTGFYTGDNGPPQNAGLSLPTDVAVDKSGNLYIADYGNTRIRMVSNNLITTVAGRTNAPPTVEGEEAVNARLSGPTGVGVDRSGNFYITESSVGSSTGLTHGIYKVWKVSAAGIINTFAGNGLVSFGGDNGAASSAQLDTPTAVAIDSNGNLLIADSQNQRVRRVSRGTITTAAGTGVQGFNGELLPPLSAQINTPRGVAADARGDFYLADTSNNRIRGVQTGGNLFTIAGNGNASYFGDATPATKASVNMPEGIAVDSVGNVYIADTLDNAIRRVSTDGVINTIAGFGTPGSAGDLGPATKAQLDHPRAVAVDQQGNIYIADTGGGRVRKVNPLGDIATIAGNGTSEFAPGDGVATQQGLSDPRGVAVDNAGNVYVSDTGHNRVRRITPAGSIQTIAGTGDCCYAGDGGLAISALLNHPQGLAVDSAGNIYIADTGNNAVRVLTPVSGGIQIGAVTNAASNLPGSISPGEVVTIYGTGLAGVQAVLFNGIAAPMLYATGTQVGAIVPYAVTGSTVQVTVQGNGATSAPVTVSLAPSAPGIFTVDGSGRGQAAALNQNNVPNGDSTPAAAGSVITLYATGEGQTSPPGVDGSQTGTILPKPLLPVSLTIGGVTADVQYAGGAPGIVAGILQVNAVVPGGLSGTVPVVLTVGGVPSQSGVTIVVR